MKSFVVMLTFIGLTMIASCVRDKPKGDDTKVISCSSELKGTSWTSEVLTSFGEFYVFEFHDDCTYDLSSLIPFKPVGLKNDSTSDTHSTKNDIEYAVAILTGNYTTNSTSLILDKDTISINRLGSDTIEILGGPVKNYKIFRKKKTQDVVN